MLRSFCAQACEGECVGFGFLIGWALGGWWVARGFLRPLGIVTSGFSVLGVLTLPIFIGFTCISYALSQSSLVFPSHYAASFLTSKPKSTSTSQYDI